ncbi:MAG: hypothetical protein ACAF41_17080 [Leptolyngbya sp. BL-A-14]
MVDQHGIIDASPNRRRTERWLSKNEPLGQSPSYCHPVGQPYSMASSLFCTHGNSGEQNGWVAVPPSTRTSTYKNPNYQKAAYFALIVAQSHAIG